MKTILSLVGLLALVTTFPAISDTHCKGKVTYLAIGRSGTVLVNGPGGLPSVYLCNVQNKVNNIEVESCKAIYSTLLAAKSQDKTVNITFLPNIDSCSSFKSWSVAKNLNWVFAS
ncbi:hypothetical protein GCM10007906_19080 [Vibrio hyugaensis]|uniref:Uncharacterized protein n=2 Tax=Vibrio hyugaensis TaxID=1534743 RepID=A0ABQ5Y027_9VIBR|nr:hypothetical protein [Vibrio hyugaensis]GLR04321.1 hypothetical protein GCM10007906_19080 [Vibrio hyugaensis]